MEYYYDNNNLHCDNLAVILDLSGKNFFLMMGSFAEPENQESVAIKVSNRRVNLFSLGVVIYFHSNTIVWEAYYTFTVAVVMMKKQRQTTKVLDSSQPQLMLKA